jgi:hypothetical protein
VKFHEGVAVAGVGAGRDPPLEATGREAGAIAREVKEARSAPTGEFGDQPLEVERGNSGSEGGDRGRRGKTMESESVTEVRTRGEGGVGFVVGPSFERAE